MTIRDLVRMRVSGEYFIMVTGGTNTEMVVLKVAKAAAREGCAVVLGGR